MCIANMTIFMRTVRADPHGRLTIIALLGDENVHQQFSENPVSLTASEYTEAVPFTMQGDSSVFNKTMVSIKKEENGSGAGFMELLVLLGLVLILSVSAGVFYCHHKKI